MIRRFFLPVVTVITSIVFLGKLISLQLLNSSYKLLSDSNAVIENSIYPERGYIYDRNLKLLVSNQPVYDLMAIPENISSFDTPRGFESRTDRKNKICKNLFCKTTLHHSWENF